MKNPPSPSIGWGQVPPARAGSCLAGVGDEGVDPLMCVGGDEGAHHRAVREGIAAREVRDRRDEPFRELVVAGGLDEDAGGRDAGLAGRPERGPRRLAGGMFEVGVGEDEEWALAPELKRYRRPARAAHARDLAAGRGRAGECHLVDPAVRDQRAPGIGAAGYDVEDSGRQARLAREHRVVQGREAGERRRLHHRRVPRRERVRGLLRDLEERRVPGRERPDHAVGLEDRRREDVAPERHHPPFQLVRRPRAVLELLGAPRRLGPGLGEGPPAVLAVEAREP